MRVCGCFNPLEWCNAGRFSGTEDELETEIHSNPRMCTCSKYTHPFIHTVTHTHSSCMQSLSAALTWPRGLRCDWLWRQHTWLLFPDRDAGRHWDRCVQRPEFWCVCVTVCRVTPKPKRRWAGSARENTRSLRCLLRFKTWIQSVMFLRPLLPRQHQECVCLWIWGGCTDATGRCWRWKASDGLMTEALCLSWRATAQRRLCTEGIN